MTAGRRYWRRCKTRYSQKKAGSWQTEGFFSHCFGKKGALFGSCQCRGGEGLLDTHFSSQRRGQNKSEHYAVIIQAQPLHGASAKDRHIPQSDHSRSQGHKAQETFRRSQLLRHHKSMNRLLWAFRKELKFIRDQSVRCLSLAQLVKRDAHRVQPHDHLPPTPTTPSLPHSKEKKWRFFSTGPSQSLFFQLAFPFLRALRPQTLYTCSPLHPTGRQSGKCQYWNGLNSAVSEC